MTFQDSFQQARELIHLSMKEKISTLELLLKKEDVSILDQLVLELS